MPDSDARYARLASAASVVERCLAVRVVKGVVLYVWLEEAFKGQTA